MGQDGYLEPVSGLKLTHNLHNIIAVSSFKLIGRQGNALLRVSSFLKRLSKRHNFHTFSLNNRRHISLSNFEECVIAILSFV